MILDKPELPLGRKAAFALLLAFMAFGMWYVYQDVDNKHRSCAAKGGVWECASMGAVRDHVCWCSY